MAVFTGTTIEEAKEKARTQLKPTVNQTIELDDAKRKWMQ